MYLEIGTSSKVGSGISKVYKSESRVAHNGFIEYSE